MNTSGGEDVEQANVTTDLIQNVVDPNSGLYPRDSGRDSPIALFVELIRQISPLRSEDPEAILQFFVLIEEIFELGLVDDRI
jgi:hypothetical protein